MKTRMLIPAAVAMSLHALVLFGFRHPPARPPVHPVRPVDPLITPVVFEAPPEFALTDPAVARPPRGDPDPLPRSEEPPAPPDHPAMEFVRPSVTPNPNPVHAAVVIPSGPFGDPQGSSNLTGPGIISARLLDNPPRTRSQTAPVYPFQAKSEGRPGEVLVEFTVDERGCVLNPRVIRSNDVAFEEPTLRAIAKWRFEPGRKDGHAVRFRMALPVQFKLND
jgi:protein TonB